MRSTCLTVLALLIGGCAASPTGSTNPPPGRTQRHKILVADVTTPDSADEPTRTTLQRELFSQLEQQPAFEPMTARADASGRAGYLLAVRAVVAPQAAPGDLVIEGRLLHLPSGNLVALAAGEGSAAQACQQLIAGLEAAAGDDLARKPARGSTVQVGESRCSRTARRSAPELADQLEPRLRYELEAALLAADHWRVVPNREELELVMAVMDGQDMGKLEGATLVLRASVDRLDCGAEPKLEISLRTLGMPDGRIRSSLRGETVPKPGPASAEEQIARAVPSLVGYLIVELKKAELGPTEP